MQKIPKYVLKNKRLSKTKAVFIFRRNYLDIEFFKYTKDGWFFEERFNFHGSKCYFSMLIRNDNIFSMYDVNCKSFKVRGKKNCFGIFIRTNPQGNTFHIICSCKSVEFTLDCSGKTIAYDNGKGLHKKKKKQQFTELPPVPQYNSKRSIPSSVSWIASHPFQGGGVSPR